MRGRRRAVHEQNKRHVISNVRFSWESITERLWIAGYLGRVQVHLPTVWPLTARIKDVISWLWRQMTSRLDK